MGSSVLTPSESDILVGEAVNSWLRFEAHTSSHDHNHILDVLADGQAAIAAGTHPKHPGHVNRLELWLASYDEPGMPRPAQEAFVQRIAFGGLMFLSGAYRRQRFLQSTDQADYDHRKRNWQHPHSIEAASFMRDEMAALCDESFTVPDVRAAASRMISATNDSLAFIGSRAPQDFGKDDSESVGSSRAEQAAGFTFLSVVLQHGSMRFNKAPEELLILEPRSMSTTQPTTLAEVAARKTPY